MLMSAGNSSFSRRRRVSAGIVVLTSRCATCAAAWTPASVRPDPYSSKSVRRVTARTARSSSPCTVRAFFWICHPLYRVPAYSMVSLKRGIKTSGGSGGAGEARGSRRSQIIIGAFMAEGPAPRLVVTDALGRRIVPIDKPLFTMGRRSETDLRLPGADISRVHAEISLEKGTCTIRDKQSRFGTFVNGERTSEKTLTHGDTIRLGQAGDTEIVFFVDD